MFAPGIADARGSLKEMIGAAASGAVLGVNSSWRGEMILGCECECKGTIQVLRRSAKGLIPHVAAMPELQPHRD